MDMRIEDNKEEIIAEERRAQEKKAGQRTSEQFKKAVLDAQAGLQASKDKFADKKLKELGRREGDVKDKLRKGVGVSADNRRSDVKDGEVKMDDILGALQSEDKSDFERRFESKRDKRVERERQDDEDPGSEGVRGEEERPEASQHELDRAVVRGSYSGEGGGAGGQSAGGEAGQDDSDRDPERSDDIESLEERPPQPGAGRRLALGSKAPVQAERASTVASAAASSPSFNASLQSRLPRKLPESLLRKIVDTCKTLVDPNGEGVELALSRHLFDGMKIRVRKGKNGELSVEFLTASPDVASFFEKERAAIVVDLQKRGLAVDLNRVRVAFNRS